MALQISFYLCSIEAEEGRKTAPEKAVMHDADFQHFIAQSLRGVIE